MTSTVDDLDLVRKVAMRYRSLGATGSTAIHPSHVPIHNEVFSPSPAEIEEARSILEAMAGAVAAGEAATRLGGVMIDYAHVRTSLRVVEHARELGIDVGDLPDVRVLSL
jgi:citrate lyase subunit beta/citryl-CoA lyase